MSNENPKKAVTELVEQYMHEKVAALDERIESMQLDFPDSLKENLEVETGLHLGKKKASYRYRIAAFFLIFIMISTAICISDPDIITAFRNFTLKRIDSESEISVDTKFIENTEDQFKTMVPEGFVLVSIHRNQFLERSRYENSDGSYILFTVSVSGLEASYDNEPPRDGTHKDFLAYEEYTTDHYNGFMIVKNGVTTIVLEVGKTLISIASDLPTEDVKTIADKIE